MASQKHGADGDVSELVSYVRRKLPVRSRLLSEEQVRDVVLMAVASWPIDGLLASARGSDDERRRLSDLKSEVQRTYVALHGEPRSGSILLAIILPAVLSAVIQVILKWWLEHRSSRTKMAVWQYGLRGRVR